MPPAGREEGPEADTLSSAAAAEVTTFCYTGDLLVPKKNNTMTSFYRVVAP